MAFSRKTRQLPALRFSRDMFPLVTVNIPCLAFSAFPCQPNPQSILSVLPMQPNRPPAMPHFRQGLRRAVPMNTAPSRPGYDISIRNAASARPNELIYQRFHRAPPARPPGPPVCITLDSDGEEVEPVAKKARQSTDEVICLDSDTDQADSDSDDVIILDSDSDAGLESDSDDVVHVQTITYSRVGDKSREGKRY